VRDLDHGDRRVVVDRIAHVAVGAGPHLEETLRFYRELLGVVPVGRSDSTVYLAGGRKPSYDIAIGPWDPGLHHVAFEVGSEGDLEKAEERLRAAGAQVEEIDPGDEHGVESGIRFVLPSGHLMELVVVSGSRVFPGTPMLDRRHFVGVGPTALEHVTLNLDDVEETASFLVETLDFRVTEYSRGAGDDWYLAFTRARELHHDLGLFRNGPGDSGPKLNHYGFVVQSVGELVRAADIARGLGVFLQCSPGRHLVGDNIFVYIADPAGNRVEIATPLTRVEAAAPTRVFDATDDSEWIGNFDAWRVSMPPAARTALPCFDARTALSAGAEE
jgi:catechol 2,3-dioxygenase